MEPEARYTLVGGMLLALVFAVAVSLVWLQNSGRRSDFRYYTIHFDHASLDGLQVGGDVNMRGIKVGRIDDYSISRDNINRVDATIRIDRRAPVSENTVATISRNVLTGLASVNLVTSGTPGPELTKVPGGERFPVIAEGDSRELTAAIDRLALAGAGALDSLDQLLNKENREAFAATLANMRELSAALSQRMGKLDAAADALAKGSADLGTASRDIAAAVDRVAASAQPVASQAEVTLRDLSNAARNLERETAALTGKVDGITDSGALEIGATALQLRATAEILARAADRLKDPRAAILGPGPAQLGPGEKLP
ncbi:MAG TPA: MlaD family protein [Burkholderiales bacterium]|nr:MlaD family protein [Burkholderiales bacterium]HUP09030.1 MlaD family protein [Caldimonas sp.]